MIRRAWLQKHATPAAQGGEFHWYPAEGDRELRASLVEQLAGATGDLVLWQLAPGRVAWARTFAATAPSDGRRYTGLALAIAEGAGSPAELLDALVPSPAEPWREDLAVDTARAACTLPDPTAVARALLSGGAAPVGEVDRAGLPRAIAAIERRMPAAVTARARRGSWLARVEPAVHDPVARLAVAAAGSRAAAAWRLLCELADDHGDVDALAARATDDATWLATLNAWGRGRVARDVDELAETVALRVFARLASDLDPARAIAEARWHALLPRERRGELLGAVARRAPTLKGMIDG